MDIGEIRVVIRKDGRGMELALGRIVAEYGINNVEHGSLLSDSLLIGNIDEEYHLLGYDAVWYV
jgi:hypothetical protein